MVQITVYNTLSIKTTEVDFGIKKISQFELVQCKGNPLSSILWQRGMSDEDCRHNIFLSNILGRKNLLSRHLSTTQCNIPHIMSLTREAIQLCIWKTFVASYSTIINSCANMNSEKQPLCIEA